VLAAAAMRIDEVRTIELPRVTVRRRHPEPHELALSAGRGAATARMKSTPSCRPARASTSSTMA
jgi:hypothetical protein